MIWKRISGWSLAVLLGLTIAGFRPAAPALAQAAERELEYGEALAVWDLAAARRAAATVPAGPRRQLYMGIVAFFEAKYKSAEELIAAALASDSLAPGSSERADAERYLSLTRGERRALASATEIRSPDGKIIAVFSSPKDTLLAPYLFDAMAKARAELGTQLGVFPDHPVRFEILDDPAKLALVTSLTTDNIYTTGTVGVTKYRRIMMITPRVMLRGYPWLDTAVHEYVHYLLTIRTGNNAPVWLHEGLAKLLETRWRTKNLAELGPASASLLAAALKKDDLVTLDEMYPSVAMLPSQSRAALAYAEVQTMLELLVDSRGQQGLGALLDQVAAGADSKQALADAWGGSFEQFQAKWRQQAARSSAKIISRAGARDFRGIEFQDPDKPAKDSGLEDVFSHLGGGKARQHARLGVLLTVRGHHQAAVLEYERARRADKRFRDDPRLARRLGELYLLLGQPDKAAVLLTLAADAEPEQPNIAAAQGRALLLIGSLEAAERALMRAIRINPFIPDIHCDLAKLAGDPEAKQREQTHCR
ncbi:MAG: peptidase MA family metallohydrolase [Nannocystaceae bacterium]